MQPDRLYAPNSSSELRRLRVEDCWIECVDFFGGESSGMKQHLAQTESWWKTRAQAMLAWIALCLCVVAFASQVLPMAYANTNSSDWDQGDYLKIALWISEGGAFSDGNRNPLYPLILAPLATRSMTFFTTAKLLSVAIGCVGLAIAASVARQHVGIAGALATTALLANNIEYQIAAAHVDVEVLLAPLFFLAWHLCGRMMTEFASDHQPRVNTVLAAGAVTGLSYLAKGTGLLIVPIVLAMMTL